ncbi:MAG: hypothetical protein WA634_02495, partial [Silvibacterium sp.]
HLRGRERHLLPDRPGGNRQPDGGQVTGVLLIGAIGVRALVLSGTPAAPLVVAVLVAAIAYQLLHNVNLPGGTTS